MTTAFESEPTRTESDDRLRRISTMERKFWRIEEERNCYYNEWKQAEKKIRKIRSSLMWRVSKLSTAIGRSLDRPFSENIPDSLVEAIEARPPEDRAPKKIPAQAGVCSAARWAPQEALDLESRLERVTFERNGYCGELRYAEYRLRDIRSSDLWYEWRPYRRFQERLRSFLSLLGAIPGLVKMTLLLPVRAVVLVAKFATKLPGTIYTAAWAAATTLRSKLRPDGHSDLESPARVSDDNKGSFRPRVLIVSPYHLHPPNHGSAVRLVNLVRELADSCDIHLLIFSTQGENPEEREALTPYCSRINYHPLVPQLKPDPFGLRSAIAEVFRSDRAATKIRDIVLAHDIDIVQLEHAELSQYRNAVPAGVPVVLTEHDVAFRSHHRRRKLGFHTRFAEARIVRSTTVDLLRLFRYEIKNCRQVQQVYAMSEVDARYLGRFLADGASRICVAPNGVSIEKFRAPTPNSVRRGVLFVGNFNHLPNVDALEFLLKDIWPLLRLRVPDARLTIVGANPSDRVRHLADHPGVTLEGEVPDPRPYYHSHRVMVAPIRAGSGTRLKILESFAAGIPVVSTALAAEGIEAEDGTNILIADRAMDFADAIERLLTDEPLHTSVSTAACELARDRYDWRFVAQRMFRNYLELIPEEKRRGADTVTTVEAKAPADLRDIDRETAPSVSIVIPTLNGGADLERCLVSIRNQKTDFEYEIACVDSGSSDRDLDLMRRHGARVSKIEQRDFNHGFTRDHAASLARGKILVFLSQDAVPIRNDWLERIVKPLRHDASGTLAAVQGGSTDVLDPERRFFWGTAGERFYFTRESNRWIERYGGVGFSTANCAIRRVIWDRYRFGWAPILEDKKWQREIIDAGYEIASLPDVRVFHSHNYGLRSLFRRCASEGYGWRTLGEKYRLIDAVSDVLTPKVWRELRFGLQQKEARLSAEIAFPLLRPAALWWGNHFLRQVLH